MHYKNKEFVSIKDLQNNLDKYLNYLFQDNFNRLVIVREGKKEAVLLPISEYEHIKKSSDSLEMQEIAQILKDRLNTKERISHEEMMNMLDKRAKERLS